MLQELGISFVEVNLSVVQCMQEGIYEEITRVLRQYHVSPTMLNLEITESAAAYSREMLIKNMRWLSLLGITFSLDDYGSGYSNINYIVDLPFSIIKLDKYMVWSAFKKDKMREIVQNTISMFKDIHLKVVTEGVETAEMSDALEAMGADYMQGYYYAKPLSEDALIALLRRENVDEEEAGNAVKTEPDAAQTVQERDPSAVQETTRTAAQEVAAGRE